MIKRSTALKMLWKRCVNVFFALRERFILTFRNSFFRNRMFGFLNVLIKRYETTFIQPLENRPQSLGDIPQSLQNLP